MCIPCVHRRCDERNRQRKPDEMMECDTREKHDEQSRQEQGEHQFRFQCSDIHFTPNLPNEIKYALAYLRPDFFELEAYTK